MSRIGKLPINIPNGVTITIDNGVLTVQGPKGTLKQALHPQVIIEQADNQLTVNVKNADNKSQRSLWGLFRRLIDNMVVGVTEGFSKKLEINGVGFKAAVSGRNLLLQLGYSHPIDYAMPEGIDIVVEKNVVTVSGIDKQVVGQTAAEIRSFKKPEPYKGKGIKYENEVVRRKVGKAAAKGSD